MCYYIHILEQPKLADPAYKEARFEPEREGRIHCSA